MRDAGSVEYQHLVLGLLVCVGLQDDDQPVSVRLRELDFGLLEGKRWDDCPADARDALAAFDGFEAPGGESVAQLGSRVLGFVEALPDGEHLLITHGGVIHLLLLDAGADQQVEPGALVRLPRQ